MTEDNASTTGKVSATEGIFSSYEDIAKEIIQQTRAQVATGNPQAILETLLTLMGHNLVMISVVADQLEVPPDRWYACADALGIRRPGKIQVVGGA